MPAKAGIQGLLLDSRQEHAGMTTGGNGHFILRCCTKDPKPFIEREAMVKRSKQASFQVGLLPAVAVFAVAILAAGCAAPVGVRRALTEHLSRCAGPADGDAGRPPWAGPVAQAHREADEMICCREASETLSGS